MANVFISYRKNDVVLAQQLAQEIKNAAHHNVWFDEWEITIGDSIIERMGEGLEGSSYLVLCFSSSGISSNWIGREWMSTLARQLNGQNIKILPVILSGGKPPAILADLKYINLTQNWNDGIKQILLALA